MNWTEISKELTKKLDPKYVKEPPQGKYGQYIEGWHAIAEANRIFGFGGWSYDVTTLQLTNASEDGGKHRVGYMAQVVVTVDGVQRGDVGHGQGFGKSEGDAHDSAVKEAVTDALKRALRSFGNPFGLALYDKSKANVGVDVDWQEQADRICARINETTDKTDLARVWGEEGSVLSGMKEAALELYREVYGAFGNRGAELSPKEAAE